MACCYIAAFMIGQLVKTCQFLDINQGIKYNEEQRPSVNSLGLSPFISKAVDKGSQELQSSLIISLDGLTCSACTAAVEDAVKALPGVSKVRASLTMQQATVLAQNGTGIDKDQVLEAIQNAGYEARVGPRAPKEILEMLAHKEKIAALSTTFSQLIQCAAVLQALSWAIHLAVGRASLSSVLRKSLQLASIVVMIYVQYGPAYDIHLQGSRWWRGGRTNMNTLTSLAMGLGTALPLLEYFAGGRFGQDPDFTTAVRLGLVVVAGKYVDSLSRRAAAKDIEEVYKPMLETDMAVLYPDMQEVPSVYLKPGDRIVVKPHTTIPCDAYVLEGSSLVGQSIVTGESLPVKKTIGSFLLGGTRNFNERLICAVQKEKGESFYTTLIQSAVETASTSSSDSQWIDSVARYFVIAIIAISVGTTLLQAQRHLGTVPLLDVIHAGMLRMVTILTCACPCALTMAIPSATVATVVTACRRGILLTGGIDTISNLNQSRCIVFDKTGTLTHAKLDVGDFLVPEESKWSTSTLWQFACALESQVVNDHPIARAIFSSGLQKLGAEWVEGQHLRTHRDVQSSVGRGVKGFIQLPKLPWCKVVIGSERYLAESGYAVSLEKVSSVLNTDGTIIVHLGVNKEYAGSFLINDTVRQEARGVVRGLAGQGLQCGLLTGDTEEAAGHVSRQLELPVYKARALPDVKQDYIRDLQKQGRVVTMVGDGLNDAPALAAADVGINFCKDAASGTIGGSVTIVNSQLASLPALFQMVKLTMKQVRFNLSWVLAYNAITLAIATEVFAPFGLRLSPSYAAFLMSFSSVFLSFQGWRPQKRLEQVPQDLQD